MTPAEAAKAAAKAKRDALVEAMALQLRALGISFEREYHFHPKRAWRFDFIAWIGLPRQPVALEVEGGIYSGGRHVRGDAFEKDCEKYAEAALLGWRVFRAGPNQVKDGTALRWIERALQP